MLLRAPRFGYNEHPAIASLWNRDTERPFCWIGYACIDDNGAPCPRVYDANYALHNTGNSFNARHQCVMCQTRECVEGYYGTTPVGDTDPVEQYTYCPVDSSRRQCQFWRDGTGERTDSSHHYDSNFPQKWFDIEWPPTKSAYQQSDTPAPTAA